MKKKRHIGWVELAFPLIFIVLVCYSYIGWVKMEEREADHFDRQEFERTVKEKREKYHKGRDF